jgi:hypothetical protein
MLGISANKKWVQNNFEVDFHVIRILSHFTNFPDFCPQEWKKQITSKVLEENRTWHQLGIWLLRILYENWGYIFAKRGLFLDTSREIHLDM